MNYKIEAIEYYLPSVEIDNDYLSNCCGIDKQFMAEKVGILKRHIAEPNEYTSDLGIKSAELLFSKHKFDKSKIGLVLLCTQNPDFRLPTTACLIQDRLGLEKSCIAFDVNLGCSGFVYSLEIAGNFIRSGKVDYALIIMADQYSKIIDYKDKNTAPIFGDAGTSILLSKCEDSFGVIASNFGSDGSGWDKLIAYNTSIKKDQDKSSYVFMDGLEIYKFAVRVIPSSINNLLQNNSIDISNVKHVIFHQANTYIIKELQKKLKLNDSQLIIDMANYGNTIQSTIPIALKNLLNKSNLNKGDLLIFSGYGVGLSWGNILYKYI